MKKYIVTVFFTFLLFICLSLPGAVAAPYYQGATITIIVGSNPGGGYDSMARIVARHLPKFIPGKPTVIINNMPGAGHMIAANYIYNIAKPDGKTIGTYNRGLPFAQLSKTAGAKFDMTKYVWIASMSVDPTVFFIRTDLPYKTADDIKKANMPLMVATEGPSSTNYQFPLLLREFAGFNVKLINYLTGSDCRMALERKEADAFAASYSPTKNFVDRGILRAVIRGQVTIPEIKNLPMDQDFVTDKKGKTIMSMLSSVDLISRPFMLPPRTPEKVATILREAFEKVANDPAAKEEARKMNVDLQYTSAEECMNIINFYMNQPEDIIKEFNKYVSF